MAKKMDDEFKISGGGSSSVGDTKSAVGSDAPDLESIGSDRPEAESITASTPSKKRRRTTTQGSFVERIPGVRRVKEYPLTKAEMHQLQGIGLIATVCISLSTGIVGFLIDIQKDLSLSENAPPKAVSFWSGVWWAALVAAIILFFLGLFAIWRGQTRIQEIEDETDHGPA